MTDTSTLQTFNEFVHEHEYVISYELKEITQNNPHKQWYLIQFAIPTKWEHINEIDVFMVNNGFKSFPMPGKLTYIKSYT